jgi:hypothetical protein
MSRGDTKHPVKIEAISLAIAAFAGSNRWAIDPNSTVSVRCGFLPSSMGRDTLVVDVRVLCIFAEVRPVEIREFLNSWRCFHAENACIESFFQTTSKTAMEGSRP